MKDNKKIVLVLTMAFFIVGTIPAESERVNISEFGYLDSDYPELFIEFPFNIPPSRNLKTLGWQPV